MDEMERSRAAMERDEAYKQAQWVENTNDSQGLADRMLAAMNIVERVYKLKRGRPETKYDGSFLNPGEHAAWARLVQSVFEKLCENSKNGGTGE